MSEQNQNNNNQDQQDNHDYTQQGIPSVAQNNAVTPNQKNAKKLLFLAFLIGLAALIWGITHYKFGSSDDADKQANSNMQALTSSKSVTKPVLPPKDPEPDPVVPVQTAEPESDLPPLTAKADASGNVQVSSGSSVNVVGPNGEPEVTTEQLKYAAPMMGNVINNSQESKTGYAHEGYSEEDKNSVLETYKNSLNGINGGSESNLTSKMNAMETPDGTARVIRKPSLTLSKGTMIECILETRVDTSVPGIASCVIPQNIYSMDGRVLLIEKGTKAIGEYQGAVQNGLERIFMLWSELRTPEGLAVSLSSPTTDALGGAGMGGYTDHHWWKRFGNALMFSMVADGFEYMVNTANSNTTNNNVTYENSSDGMDEIIKAAMQQSGNIPPTLIKNAGERVGIFVARDVNFSSVYHLQKR